MRSYCGRKEKQEELLKKKNEETLARLTAQQSGAGGPGGAGGTVGRKVSETFAYRSVTDMPLARDLRIQVRSTGQLGVSRGSRASGGLLHTGTPMPSRTGVVRWCEVDCSYRRR